MAINIENIWSKDKNIPDAAYPVVRESDTCPHWENAGNESVSPMRECWYCKYSDFRKDFNEHRNFSVCRCSINQCNREEKEK